MTSLLIVYPCKFICRQAALLSMYQNPVWYNMRASGYVSRPLQVGFCNSCLWSVQKLRITESDFIVQLRDFYRFGIDTNALDIWRPFILCQLIKDPMSLRKSNMQVLGVVLNRVLMSHICRIHHDSPHHYTLHERVVNSIVNVWPHYWWVVGVYESQTLMTNCPKIVILKVQHM